MSLPSILDYLADVDVIKMAAEEPPQRKPPSELRATPNVIRAGLQGAAITAAGTGLGYGAGKLLGYGADALSKKLTGEPMPITYFPMALAALGTLAGAAEAARLRRYKELLRNAYERSPQRAARSDSE